MLRPVRKRDLGHVEHCRIFEEAKSKIDGLLEYAGREEQPEL
jgi:hypothetical protein